MIRTVRGGRAGIGEALDLVLLFAAIGTAEAAVAGAWLEGGTLASHGLWQAALIHAGLALPVAMGTALLGRSRPSAPLLAGLLLSSLVFANAVGPFEAQRRDLGTTGSAAVLGAALLPAAAGWWWGRRRGARGLGPSLRVVLVLALGVGLAAARVRELRARTVVQGPDVLFIVLDTTRKDRMSAYGYDRPTTPALARLAGEGVRFDRAISASPWTLPSHASMFTGLHPSQHGATRPEHLLRDDVPTLAEEMAATGRRTVAFGKKAWLAPESGVMRGFAESVDLLNPKPPQGSGTLRDLWRRLVGRRDFLDDKGAEEINANVMDWLRRHRGEPFFAFINYNEAHAHLQPPTPYREEYLGEHADSPWGLDEFPDTIAYNRGDVQYSAQDIARFNDLYDAEVAYQDQRLGELLDFLRDEGVLEQLLVVVTADHGESLGEHGEFGHGPCMHEPVLNVPLVVRCPQRLPAGVVVTEAVQTRHLKRLVEWVVGIGDAAAHTGADGWMAALDDPSGAIVSEVYQRPVRGSRVEHDLWAVRAGDLKLIYSSRGHHELYDLAADPLEQHNLIDEHPERARQLAAIALQYQEQRRPTGRAATLRRETIQKLKAMGYVMDDEDG